MGTLGKKLRVAEASDEYAKLRDLIIPIHCEYGIDNLNISGSLRRGKQIDIGDIDVVVTTIDGKFDSRLSKYLSDAGYIIDASGDKIIRMLTKSDVQIDLYATDESHFYPMMCYLTGPSQYNTGMRVVARKKGYK